MAGAQRIASLLDLLKTEPDDVFLNYALGMEYAADPEKQELAGTCFKRVIQLNPHYIAAYYQLGKLNEAMNTAEAIAFYRTGLAKAREQKNNKAINEFGEALFMLED